MKNTLGGQFYFSRHVAEAQRGSGPGPLASETSRKRVFGSSRAENRSKSVRRATERKETTHFQVESGS
jgi:hypothetical protein